MGDRGKEGSQVRVSDSERPQRTHDIFLNFFTPERIALENAALSERRYNLRGSLPQLRLFSFSVC